ncbi:hypothetical protein GCM10011519_25880 [Marmoricola endophyticus]|uniref:Uncharacterized protein n=1 Tax=Marmoricola endophyticus TaxID=2040280 RepID=A0A917BNF4_9ACTN|nr:hypothetical protein [Marmoricola endophyticus]GGF50743.1 hypothetical protein GCM10011519_25880 [Marmoricola endophyticus]
MTSLPPGVTRYPRSAGRVGRPFHPVFDPALVAVVVVGGLVLALADSVPVRTVLLALGVGLVLPPLTWALHWLVRIVVCVAALVVALAIDSSVHLLGATAVFFWIICVFSGLIVLSGLVQRRRRLQRLASAEGAPPSGRDPGSSDAGFMATWDDADYDYEMADPDLETVLDAVRALDGRERTYVSVFRGRGRLDVGGDARTDLVVQHTRNRVVWGTVCDPTQPDPVEDKAARTGTRTSVVYGRQSMTVHRYRLTTLAWAEQAVRVWVTTGERDQTLPWWDSSANWPAPRPVLFKATGG